MQPVLIGVLVFIYYKNIVGMIVVGLEHLEHRFWSIFTTFQGNVSPLWFMQEVAFMNSCVQGASILIPGGRDGNPLALT